MHLFFPKKTSKSVILVVQLLGGNFLNSGRYKGKIYKGKMEVCDCEALIIGMQIEMRSWFRN